MLNKDAVVRVGTPGLWNGRAFLQCIVVKGPGLRGEPRTQEAGGPLEREKRNPKIFPSLALRSEM